MMSGYHRSKMILHSLLLSIDQAAQILGVAPDTVRDWDKRFRRRAKLDPRVHEFASRILRVGRAVRIPADAVDELIQYKGNGKSSTTMMGGIEAAETGAWQAINEHLGLLCEIREELRRTNDLLECSVVNVAGESTDREASQ